MPNKSALDKQFNDLLDQAIERQASDLHLMASVPPQIRVDGRLQPLDEPVLTDEVCNDLVTGFIGRTLHERILADRKELDFGFSYRSVRFRCNVFFQRGTLAASLRLLSNVVHDLTTLGVPPIAGKLLEHNQGLIVVSGPTGHGKSTTLAAMVDQLAKERSGHIITIEDPIEYVFENRKSILSQREVGIDTPSFASALRAALREDPDVVLLGEMRDQETMEVALQLAETGHLVLTSLHTNSAAQTASRIVDVFPPHQQAQVRMQLSEVLLGVFSQRLLPRVQGGRVLASEVFIINSAGRTMIREGKAHQLPNLIQTSAAEGMVSLDKSLADLVIKGDVALDDAMAWSLDPKALKMIIY